MNCCSVCLNAEEREARRVNKLVEKKIKADQKEDENEYKLLILGTGESGKSTFLRQIKLIYGTGFDLNEKMRFIGPIRSNLITCILSAVDAATKIGIIFKDRLTQNSINNLQQSVSQLDVITDIVKESVEYLCENEELSIIIDNSCKYKLPDSTEYYLNVKNRMRILSIEYVPDVEDIVRLRVPTTGIVQFNFQIKNINFKMIDVGGQRSERRKWIHCFDNVTSIIFMVSLSEYDQILVEDPNQNRMVESLALFKAIISYPEFLKMPFILLLNKMDLFEKKLHISPLTNYFPEYTGNNDVSDASRFILSRFLAQNPYPDKMIYSHFTCATDTNNITFVFEAVKDAILQKNLSQFQLV